jgi:glycosyltransferase involved in cell wall biosynthesis
VIVLSYRNEGTIAAAVESLCNQSELVEVIVSHSGGGATPALLRERFPSVRVVTAETRRLPGAARNAGLEQARGSFIAFLAGDCQASPGWAAGRLRYHRAGAAAVASVIAPLERRRSSVASHLLQHSDRMPHVEAPPYFRFGVSYTRELINRIGPFPEDLEFAEDVVVNWRALCAGVSIVLAPEVVTLHYYPPSCRAMLADQFRRGRLRAGVPATSLWRYELVGRALASVLVAYRRASRPGSSLGRRERVRVIPPLIGGALAKALGAALGNPPSPSAVAECEFHRWIRAGARSARASPDVLSNHMARVTVACLLPARNCADDLPAYFESVARFADAVVALDDGSTDRTHELLAAHPLVRVVLSNPRRPSYTGWDDAANRNRLLAAAANLHPSFIISIDSDERIAPDDAAALREFVQSGARRDCAYLLPLYGMVEDEAHYAGQMSWHGRLFGHHEGQVFSTRRLHLVPIPLSIPKSRWFKTTIRIQHIGGLTEERRRLRFEKYREVDPDCVFQKSYLNLIAPRRGVKRWQPRLPNLPVVANDRFPDLQPLDKATPLLSVIVISQNDEATIHRALQAVAAQDCVEPFEVIVVNSGNDETAAVVRKNFPEVKLVRLQPPAFPGRARNAGLAMARGRYVTFPGSHVELLPGSLAARAAAHQLGYGLVTGTMLNGTRTWAGWASYFLDNRLTLPGRPSAPLHDAPPRASYLREALLAVGGFPEDMRVGEDTVVNRRLFDGGYGAYQVAEARSIHYSPCHRPRQLVRHHFRRGQGMAHVLLLEAQENGRFSTRRVLRYVLTIVPARLVWITLGVLRYGHTVRRHYVVALPLVVIGAISAWAGTCYELVRSGRAVSATLLGAPQSEGERTAFPGEPLRRAADDIPTRRDVTVREPRLRLRPIVAIPSAGLGRPRHRVRLLALLQARNEMPYLPGFMRNVSPHVDGIVALDDGSTDGSAEFLASRNEVLELLPVPPERPAWDEVGNHRALLDAALRHAGDWVICVDADERLECDFRARAERVIRRGRWFGFSAYQLRLRELWDSAETYRVAGIWGRKRVARLFRLRADHMLDVRPLHSLKTPLQARKIGPSLPIADLLIYHLRTIRPADRMARRKKYEQLDPDARWQPGIGYAYLTDERNVRVRRVEERRRFL